MPWLSILLALLSFFTTKKSTGSTGKALLAAGLVGGATYAVTHGTDWGAKNLGQLDGVSVPDSASAPLLDQSGNPVMRDGVAVTAPVGTTAVVNSEGVVQKLIGSTGDVLKSWGAVGTAAVVGTAALAASGELPKYLPLVLGAVALVFLIK